MERSFIDKVYKLNPTHNNKITLSLMRVCDYVKHHDEDVLECNICYKRIHNKMFVCSHPCNKIFHQECIEKMIERIDNVSSNTIEDESEIIYKCCYCCREFDINNYTFELFIYELSKYRSRGYVVSDAMTQAAFDTLIATDYNEQRLYNYNIYTLMDVSYIKTPKQSKRAEYNPRRTWKPTVSVKRMHKSRR
jgi:hypothetical protein